MILDPVHESIRLHDRCCLQGFLSEHLMHDIEQLISVNAQLLQSRCVRLSSLHLLTANTGVAAVYYAKCNKELFVCLTHPLQGCDSYQA